MISEETVQHVAKLARLQLSEDDVHRYTKDLGNILTLVDELSALDLSTVDMSMETAEPTLFRDDVVMKKYSREALMANAPKEEDGFFWVPKILDDAQ